MTETPVSAPQLHPRRAVPRSGDCYAMLAWQEVQCASRKASLTSAHPPTVIKWN